MSKIKISCIIPTCDRPEYLKEALQSVGQQGFKPHEIIVVNNGKADLPPLEGDVRVYRIIRYAGVSQARNFGAGVATGDYLAFLDDDDLWDKDYLANVAKALEGGAECVISRLDALRREHFYPYKNAHGKLKLSKLLVSNPGVTGSNVVCARQLFFDVGGYDPRLSSSEDKSLVIEIIKRSGVIVTLPGNRAYIREHEGERLSNPQHLADGIYFFIRKYGALMNWRVKLINKQKMYFNRYRRGEKLAILPYGFLAVFNKIMRV